MKISNIENIESMESIGSIGITSMTIFKFDYLLTHNVKAPVGSKS